MEDGHPQGKLGRIADAMLLSCPEEERAGLRAIVLVVEPNATGNADAAIAAAGYEVEEGREQESLREMFRDLFTAARTTALAAGVNMSVFEAPVRGQG